MTILTNYRHSDARANRYVRYFGYARNVARIQIVSYTIKIDRLSVTERSRTRSADFTTKSRDVSRRV